MTDITKPKDETVEDPQDPGQGGGTTDNPTGSHESNVGGTTVSPMGSHESNAPAPN